LVVAQLVEPGGAGAFFQERNREDEVIARAREGDVEEAYAFAVIALADGATEGGGRCALREGGGSALLLGERPRPVADPAAAEGLGCVEGLSVGFRGDLEGVATARAVEARDDDDGPFEVLSLTLFPCVIPTQVRDGHWVISRIAGALSGAEAVAESEQPGGDASLRRAVMFARVSARAVGFS
jgi:hypothetical protein